MVDTKKKAGLRKRLGGGVTRGASKGLPLYNGITRRGRKLSLGLVSTLTRSFDRLKFICDVYTRRSDTIVKHHVRGRFSREPRRKNNSHIILLLYIIQESYFFVVTVSLFSRDRRPYTYYIHCRGTNAMRKYYYVMRWEYLGIVYRMGLFYDCRGPTWIIITIASRENRYYLTYRENGYRGIYLRKS